MSPPQDGFAAANLGQRPKFTKTPKAPALKARFTCSAKPFESRFQRLDPRVIRNPRALPQAEFEAAPSALNRSSCSLPFRPTEQDLR